MSGKLHTEPHIDDPDDFYSRLIAMHEGLDSAQSHDLNCKLILLMANHIGDQQALREALDIAGKYRP
jgi:hypothetical protein